MQNSTFIPQALNVTVGATIIWVNHDGFSHTSTSVNSTGWDSLPISPGHRFSLTIESNFSQGVYYYHCNIHPMMIALINVVA
ncbi:MAG: cupredoxin domain-containing protein [Nitrososphaerales archaeon]